MARIQGWWWRYPTMAIVVVIGFLAFVGIPIGLIVDGAFDLIAHPHHYVRDGTAIIVGIMILALANVWIRHHPMRGDQFANRNPKP